MEPFTQAFGINVADDRYVQPVTDESGLVEGA
ncbi:hypothetical protein X759_34795 [Mesorhizobium sp. LSHC420B00]|nr:hypothetical protein X759_34795 [Mesorhizobium sp. LSHC420B00]